MATIENLGAAFIRHFQGRPELPSRSDEPPAKVGSGREGAAARANRTEFSKPEKANEPRRSSVERGRAHEKPERPSHRSIAELAEVLRRMNLYLDLFEIQMKFTVNQTSGDILVEVINQRTGEVIRKIPPYEVTEFAESLMLGEPVVTDVEA